MNESATSIAIKLVMTFIVAAIAFYFLVRNPWSWILIVSMW